MSWFSRKAETLTRQPALREVVLALANLEQQMALDLSRLQAAVAAQGTAIQNVQTRVTALEAGQENPADQAAIDGIATTVEGNNATLTTLASS